MNDNGAQTRDKELVNLASLIARRLLAASLGQSFGGDRDYYEALGYPLEIAPEDYLARYERQDIAGRIVDLPASDTWRVPPQVSEADDTSGPFVQAWDELVKRRRVWSYLSRVDRLSGIGRYGVLLIGMRDGGQPLSEPAKRGILNGPHNITYLRALSEVSATVSQWDWNPQSARFGMPLTYSVHLDEGQGFHSVHYTRVIHVAENKLDSETYGIPRLQRVYNRLEDMTKIVGGSAEATWLLVRKGLLITTLPGYEFPSDDAFEEDFETEVDEYLHGISRVMRIPGADVKDLGSEVPDPSNVFEITLSLISAASGIPKRVLIGSAAGELSAASEDMNQWYGHIAWRQTNYAEPDILRLLIDRLIWLGALPAPATGSYDVGEVGPDGRRHWPPLAVMSEADKTAVIERRAGAVQKLADPLTGQLPLNEAESRDLLGYPPQRESPEGLAANDALTDYGLGIRQAVRGLWAGEKDIFEAADLMIRTIQDGLRQAWIDGARRAGLEEFELTTRELAELELVTQEEIGHVMAFLQEVERQNRASKSPLTPLITRSFLWLGRAREVMNRAMQQAANDPKLKWVLDPKKENCLSCSALANKVKRASQWEEAGLQPQSDRLECIRSAGGVRVCGCRFEVTDEPLTRGVLPVI